MECLHVLSVFFAYQKSSERAGETKKKTGAIARLRMLCSSMACYVLIFMTDAHAHARYHEQLRGIYIYGIYIFCLWRIRPLTKPDDALGFERNLNFSLMKERAKNNLKKEACNFLSQTMRFQGMLK